MGTIPQDPPACKHLDISYPPPPSSFNHFHFPQHTDMRPETTFWCLLVLPSALCCSSSIIAESPPVQTKQVPTHTGKWARPDLGHFPPRTVRHHCSFARFTFAAGRKTQFQLSKNQDLLCFFNATSISANSCCLWVPWKGLKDLHKSRRTQPPFQATQGTPEGARWPHLSQP